MLAIMLVYILLPFPVFEGQVNPIYTIFFPHAKKQKKKKEKEKEKEKKRKEKKKKKLDYILFVFFSIFKRTNKLIY